MALVLCIGLTTAAWAQIQSGLAPGQKPYPPVPPVPGEVPVDEGLAAPDEGVAAPDDAAEAPAAEDLAAMDTAATAPTSLAPNMLGDSYGGSSAMMCGWAIGSSSMMSKSYCLPVSSGNLIGRFKVAENTNPLPQCRVFFNYNHYASAFTTVVNGNYTDINVDRFTFGVEKSFLNHRASVELRVPFASTMRHDWHVNNPYEFTAAEFGDIALNFKGLLLHGCNGAVSAGLGLTFPTANDTNVSYRDGYLGIDNGSVHLHPYLGVLYTPTCRLFSEFFLQVDIDPSGNDVCTVPSFGRTRHWGVYQDQTLLMLDWSVGYWLYRACPDACGCYNRALVGLAPLLEVHYTSTISSADTVRVYNDILTNPNGGQDLLNLTAGFVVETARCWRIRAAAVVPLKESGDRKFDAEFLLQVNRGY
jgi:hypothetical protein